MENEKLPTDQDLNDAAAEDLNEDAETVETDADEDDAE